MTKIHDEHAAAPVLSPAAVAALTAEAKRLRAKTIGGTVHRLQHALRARVARKSGAGTVQAVNSPIPSPAAVASLTAEAKRLRAETIGGTVRRLGRRPARTAPVAETVEVQVLGDWYAPVIRSVLDKFAHQLDGRGGSKAANTDESNRAA